MSNKTSNGAPRDADALYHSIATVLLMLVNLLVYVNAIPELMPMPDSVRYKVGGRVWADPNCTQLIA